ncbi:MAG: hypothetical protein ACTMH5_12265 [Brachybacterium sp.]|uniref:hypothetical protein n=1 Tax=Brachybacterium sp. TaxID=1891286 RepID=UPI003F902AC8
MPVAPGGGPQERLDHQGQQISEGRLERHLHLSVQIVLVAGVGIEALGVDEE